MSKKACLPSLRTTITMTVRLKIWISALMQFSLVDLNFIRITGNSDKRLWKNRGNSRKSIAKWP